MRRSNWTPSIVPNADDQTVCLVADDFDKIGRASREADFEATDVETVIQVPADVAADINRRLSSLPKVKRYDLCLQDYDELIEEIFKSAKWNPRFFFNQMNLKAQEILVDGNKAAGLLK